MPWQSWRDASRVPWGRSVEDPNQFNFTEMKLALGVLQRIADSLESLNVHLGRLARERDTIFERLGRLERRFLLYARVAGLSPERRARLLTPVAELGLSRRTQRILLRNGLTVLAELTRCRADDLLQLKNFGKTALEEVRAKLAERDLSLRDDPALNGEVPDPDED
jgi:DNA-directed RNA polymerase alpha subunit